MIDAWLVWWVWELMLWLWKQDFMSSLFLVHIFMVPMWKIVTWHLKKYLNLLLALGSHFTELACRWVDVVIISGQWSLHLSLCGEKRGHKTIEKGCLSISCIRSTVILCSRDRNIAHCCHWSITGSRTQRSVDLHSNRTAGASGRAENLPQVISFFRSITRKKNTKCAICPVSQCWRIHSIIARIQSVSLITGKMRWGLLYVNK